MHRTINKVCKVNLVQNVIKKFEKKFNYLKKVKLNLFPRSVSVWIAAEEIEGLNPQLFSEPS